MINRSKQRNLTDDDIVDMLINYIDENLYNYAVMIDGEWGCGKTYFVTKYLLKKLELHEKEKAKHQTKYKERKVVYISLYGVNSVAEISKQILLESYLSKTGKAKELLKRGNDVVGRLLPIAFDLLKLLTGAETNKDNVSEAFSSLFPVKNNILIFDDLERCECPINEILGYINTFVELGGMKVIIVANQKEIGQNSYLANQELKYLVAAHENIIFEEESQPNKVLRAYEDKAKEIHGPVDINMVKTRMNELFGQDALYEKVKEKLVGITVFYYPALQDIFLKLIKNKDIDEKLQSFLLENLSFYEEYMVGEEHPNLRTFQFYLSKIRELYKVVSMLNSEGAEPFLKYIIKYSFKVCVCYKNGTLEYDWKGNEEYGFKAMGKRDIFGNNLAFRFVDDFVTKSVLNDETIKRMLKLYEDEYIKKRDEKIDTFRKLESEWYISDDQTIEEQIKQVIQALDANKYEVKEYSRIIGLCVELEQAGFSKEITETVVSKMKYNIQELKAHASIAGGYGILKEGKKKKRYTEIIEELQDEIDKHFQMQVNNTMATYLEKEEGWAQDLYGYVVQNLIEISNENGFLSKFDIPQLAEKIMRSKSCEIHDFRGCILALYVQNTIGEALKSDKAKIVELQHIIEGIDQTSFDKIKIMQIEYLISNLQDALNNFDDNEG